MAQTLAGNTWLAGRRVALAGRLASMSRSQAARLIAEHGGIYSRSVGRTPLLVIVGQGAWPLARDGRPTRKLRQAMALARQGHAVEIVGEEDLLARLRCGTDRLRRQFTLHELAELLGVSVERLQVWLRAGLIEPASTQGQLHTFDFRQVASAKSLCELVRSGVTIARLRHSLTRLRQWLGAVDDPLSQLTTLEQSGKLVVRLENGHLAEPSGQMLFSFSGENVESVPASLPWVAQAKTADEWFHVGCEAEDRQDFQQAVHAFGQALLTGGPSAEICFNLANALCSIQQYARAGERYRQVLELDPGFWEAWNNLGTVLTYEGENEQAIAAYRQALRLHPNYADAHYNLADTLEDVGRPEEAAEHWRAYLDLEPRGAGADYALERLHELDI